MPLSLPSSRAFLPLPGVLASGSSEQGESSGERGGGASLIHLVHGRIQKSWIQHSHLVADHLHVLVNALAWMPHLSLQAWAFQMHLVDAIYRGFVAPGTWEWQHGA